MGTGISSGTMRTVWNWVVVYLHNTVNALNTNALYTLKCFNGEFCVTCVLPQLKKYFSGLEYFFLYFHPLTPPPSKRKSSRARLREKKKVSLSVGGEVVSIGQSSLGTAPPALD